MAKALTVLAIAASKLVAGHSAFNSRSGLTKGRRSGKASSTCVPKRAPGECEDHSAAESTEHI